VRGLGEAPRTTLRGPPRRLVAGSGEAAIRSRWPSISMGRREVMISWISRHTPERIPTRASPGRKSVYISRDLRRERASTAIWKRRWCGQYNVGVVRVDSE
jgi:hypothetical protein